LNQLVTFSQGGNTNNCAAVDIANERQDFELYKSRFLFLQDNMKKNCIRVDRAIMKVHCLRSASLRALLQCLITENFASVYGAVLQDSILVDKAVLQGGCCRSRQ
jgi:hypothetical protein